MTSDQDQSRDQRGDGDRTRRDSFRFSPGNGIYAFAALGALGLFAIVAATFDFGDARTGGDALWLVPAGVVLVLAAGGLFWLAQRRPVLLAIGPDGLDLPIALLRPIAWAEIWRLRRIRRKIALRSEVILLKVELMRGARPVYQRRLWTLPRIDAWIARRFGLRIPIQNLDAPAAVIIASIERFRPVERVTT